MDKEFLEEKRRGKDEDDEFQNDFVENSIKEEALQKQQPPAGVDGNYESDREPNGMDPETIFEKGYSFQESPDELRSQRVNRFGKEPNGISPEDR